ncbi:MAG: hypothetical protein A3D93_06640 [Acidobacteria bacterium RIFCSPHIGHO2_12_FULL_67_30]|nr:MAG: hypothetical protein A3D93_06640 [Acidobacteria bacterium RIFCSPHIGHO2_12_FULL_67_30]
MVLSVESQSASEIFCTGAKTPTPALFTSTSSRPGRSRIFAKVARTWAASWTSQEKVSTPDGEGARRRAASSSRFELRATSASRCPRRASSWAMA